MTAPLPPSPAALLQARQPAAESVRGADPSPSRLPATALVLASTRQGALIESAGKRLLMHGAPPLPQGARLSLEHAAPGAAPQPARLLAIGARALAPPLAVQLQPVPSPPSAPPPRESLSRGADAVQAEARLVGAAGRPLGPPVAITLRAAPPATPQAASAMPPAGAPAGPAIASPAAGAANLSATALPGTTTALAPRAAPSSPQPPPQLAAGTVLPAEVVGRDPHGRLLLQSGALRLRLEAPLDVPPGARLTLALPVGLPPPAGAMPAPATDPMQRLIAALLQQARAGGEAPETGRLRLPAADHAWRRGCCAGCRH